MSESPPTSRIRDFLLVLAPAGVAVLLSLWPFERLALILVCGLLGYGALAIVVTVRSRRLMMAAVASLAIVISVAASNWPLRAAYALSLPSFERVANQVRAGNPPNGPALVGLFVVRKAELHDNGIVCLWTDDDPAGATGFVQTKADDLPFNLWSHVSLDGSWQFISED